MKKPRLSKKNSKNYNYESEIIIDIMTDDNISKSERILREEDSRKLSQNYYKSYFNSDSEEIKFKDYKNMKYDDIKDHTIQFSYLRFCEFLIYHIFFIIILGPFSIVLFFKKPGMFLIKNMQFYFFSSGAIFQFLPFLGFIFVLYYYITNDNNSIFFVELILFGGGLTLRIVTISLKYGSLSDDKIGFYKNQLVNKIDFENELTILFALFPSDKLIYSELMNALTRADIDRTFFWVYFYVPPHKNIAKRLKSYEDNLQKYHLRKWSDFVPIFPEKFGTIIDRSNSKVKSEFEIKDVCFTKDFKLQSESKKSIAFNENYEKNTYEENNKTVIIQKQFLDKNPKKQKKKSKNFFFNKSKESKLEDENEYLYEKK